LSCRGGNSRSARHHNLNDLVWRAMAKADIPALKEPSGLLRTAGKRPDGVTLLPWKQGKCVTWDVTASDKGKRTSIRHSLSHTCLFQSRQNNRINKDGMDFLSDLGRRITQSTNDHRESAFLFQRLSMLIQRYNAVAVFGIYLRPHNP